MDRLQAAKMPVQSIQIDLSKFASLIKRAPFNEQTRRLVFGALSDSAGVGHKAQIAKIVGMGRETISRGLRELRGEQALPEGRVRAQGGGRKKASVKQPGLLEATKEILESETYGDPERVLFWSTKSLRIIKEELNRKGFQVSHVVVGQLVEELGYSKQLNQKLLQVGKNHPRREEQFEFINKNSAECLERNIPVISIDCKKKENIGLFKNAGQEYRLKGKPRETLDHDFLNKKLGHIAPYGVYLLNDNTGFVNLGQSSDTAEFACASIEAWWNAVGKENFSKTKRLYVTCDGGGSNGSRVRLWKYALAKFADKYHIEVQVSHFPPGTSKWNKIEHKLFCYITRTWAGQPLVDIDTVIKLIGSTKTEKGLKVDCVLDKNVYQTGIKVTDEEFESIDIERLGEGDMGVWNYVIRGFKEQLCKQ